MAASSSSSFTDPFSAVYKARPGELPVFSIDNYQSATRCIGDDASLKFVAISDPKENLNHSALDTPNVFSPLLAGERDKLIRKRILSNPEHLLMSSSIALSTSASKSSSTSASKSSSTLSPSKTANGNVSSADLVNFDDDDALSWTNSQSSEESDGDETEENTLLNIQLRYTTNAISDNAIERFSMPARSSIFVSPPKNLPTLNQIRQNNRDREPLRVLLENDLKSALKSSNSDNFSTAFIHAIHSGNVIIDLDNKEIQTIPNLSHLLQSYQSTLGQNKEADKRTSLIEMMISNSNNRQAITRARSAPQVSFAPHNIFTLILSNNYLNSNSSSIQRICHLQGLRVLSLRANCLTEIPHVFGDLVNLKELNLSNNFLSFLPSSILKLKQKECQFSLNGNPWLKPSSSLDSTGRRFQWISKSKRVFYCHSPDVTSLDSIKHSIPSLLESCIRKLCLNKDSITGEETIIHHQSSFNESATTLRFKYHHHSSCLSHISNSPTLLPKPIQKLLSNPSNFFYKCELCKQKLIFNCNHDSLFVDTFFFKDHYHHHHREFFQFTKLDINSTIDRAMDHEAQGGEDIDDAEMNNMVPIRWIACSFNCCVINH